MRTSVRILFGVLPLLALPAYAQQSPNELLAPPDYYAKRLDSATPSMKSKIQSLKERARAEDWGFEPGYTSALDRTIEQLTGAKEGPSEDEARKQMEFADRAIALYRDELIQQKIPQLPEVGGAASCASASSLDYRTLGKVTPVKDQRQCSSCWAFTSVSVLESSYLMSNLGNIDASEQHVLNCTGAAQSNCSSGYLDRALTLLVKAGTDNETAERYTASMKPCIAAATPYRLVAWQQIETNWQTVVSPAKIKAALCQHGPLATRMIVDDAFGSFTGAGKVFRQVKSNLTVSSPGAHFITIAGWDDRKGRNGAWLLKNSWNTGWGDHGYAWIEYGANLVGHMAIWAQAPNQRVAMGRKFQDLVSEKLGIPNAKAITPQAD